MPEAEVPPVHTRVVPVDLYACLRREWRMEIRTEPSRASLLLLLAQWEHETGGGGACICWNLGGIKYTPGCGQNFALYSTQERTPQGALVTLHPPDPACRFRAYASLDDGVLDYLRVLRGRFGYAWPAVLAGDTADFAHRLKTRGYYTDTEANYARGLAARYAALDVAIGLDTNPDPLIGLKAAIVQPDPGKPDPPDDPPDSGVT